MFNASSPGRQGDQHAIPVSFSASTPDKLQRDPVRYDTRVTRGSRTHRHGSGLMAPYWFLGSECVVVVVGNYKFATLDLRD